MTITLVSISSMAFFINLGTTVVDLFCFLEGLETSETSSSEDDED